VIVYPAAERAFNKNLGRFQKFISFDRNWDETQLAHSYEKVEDANDAMALQDLARRAYFAVSGNCYGRVDIRKRDVSGKFYVLEVNASCGLGKGTSSEFILHLAGQTTQDFFKILLSMTLTPPADASESEISSIVATSLLPLTLKEQVSQLIDHPSLATVPTPVVHVIVSAVLIESQVLDPEQKLVSNYGKDVEYVSELEGTFRSLGYDPIVHLFHVDPIEKTLDSLDRDNDLIFNACLGSDGCAVANTLNKLGFKKTVGLNAEFFKQSSSRPATRQQLAEAGIRISPGTILELHYDATLSPTAMMQTALKDIKAKMEAEGIQFPVYLKPAQVFRHQEGQHSGRCVHTEDQLRHFLLELSSTETANGKPKNPGEVWILEALAIGTEFRVLVAGDGRDPNRDVIVLPPIKYNAPPSTVTNSLGSSTLFGSTKSLLQRRESARVMDKDQTHQASKNYTPMKSAELMLQMDIQDLARRAYSAVHGSCYGLVHLVNQSNGEGLVVLGVHGDVRFGENAKASIVMQLAGLTMSDLFEWLLQRAA
jgi:hypothetical protein